MRNNPSLLALCLWCLLALPTTRAWSGNRQKANFNSGWLLALGDIHGAETADYDDHAHTQGDKLPQATTNTANGQQGMLDGPETSTPFDNYIRSIDLPVECGVNRVLVRSTVNAGTITLTAAEGKTELRTDEVSFIEKIK